LAKTLIAKREKIEKEKERGKINGNLNLKGYMHARGAKTGKIVHKLFIYYGNVGVKYHFGMGKTKALDGYTYRPLVWCDA
jgi:hypothetical protein